ncbi:unnamed protein product, partial [Allacma fusca]
GFAVRQLVNGTYTPGDIDRFC